MAVRREEVVKTAEKLVARGKIEAAIKEYRKVIGDQPNDTITLNRMGDLYVRDGRNDEAIKLFNQTAERYTEDGFFVKAIAIYKKIQKLDPNRLEVYEKLAELYHRQGLVNDARGQYLVVAEWYQKHGNQASALTIYERMVDLEPEDMSLRAKLADLYGEQGLTDKAMAQYRSIAELMLNHGRPGEAAQVYERALDVDASDLDFVAGAVARLREAGGNAAAARLLATAVEKNPAAAGLARAAGLASVVEDEIELDLGPEPAAAAAPRGAAPRPSPAPPPAVPRPKPLPPPAAIRPPATAAAAAAEALAGDDDDGLVIDLDVGELDELPFAAPGGPAAPTAPPPAAAAPAAPAAPAQASASAARDSGEFELDLGDVFVLDLEDEEPPASLVQPPPDMVDAPPRAFDALAASAPPPAPVASAPAPAVSHHPEVVPPELDEGVFVLDEESAAAEAEAEAELARRQPTARSAAARPIDRGVSIDPDFLERTAAELLPPERQAEDLLTEAEVLARYGLEEKAAERVQEVLRLAPGHAEAMSLLIKLDLDRGNHARVIATANQLARRALEQDDDRAWRKVRKRLAEAGYRLDGDRVSGPPQAGRDTEQAVGRMIEGLLDRPPAPPGRRAGGGAKRVAEALADLEAGVRPARPAPPPARQAAAAQPPAAGAAGMDEPAAAEEIASGALAAEAGLPAFEPEPAPPRWAEFPETAAEEAAVDAGEPAAEPAAAQAAAEPAAEPLEDSGTRWLAEVEAAASSVGPGADSALAEEEDFFDLAAEIEQELEEESRDEDLLAVPREQSLEEIVEGFKQGVAESLSPEDYDTHFNLGIAYREMGLLDEAIGEFQLAAKDPSRLVECCSMLGLCFLEKGLPELAVKWYNRGLASPGLTEDDQLGLMYDLGNVHLATGDVEQARSVFVEIYGTNSHYRDVVAKLEEISAHHGR